MKGGFYVLCIFSLQVPYGEHAFYFANGGGKSCECPLAPNTRATLGEGKGHQRHTNTKVGGETKERKGGAFWREEDTGPLPEQLWGTVFLVSSMRTVC